MSNQIIRREHKPCDHLPSSLSQTLRQIYADRGIEEASQLQTSAKGLMHFDQLKGMDEAVRILAEAMKQNLRIIVIGDFDADGATSTALCILALNQLGHRNHEYLVPNRFDFGYGLSPQIVDVAHEQGANVILTVDNGISCMAGVERANELGMQVVITDHHLAGERLPAASAIVNPNQPDCSFLSKNLAGVGVAFYVMLALRSHLREIEWFAEKGVSMPNLAELLDLVALGTVADVVPLDSNNRILVHQGIQRIRSDKCRPGIQALVDIANRDNRKLAAADLGFVVGPRLNAAGRLDDISLGIECLLTDNAGKARQIAVELDSLNQSRREIEASMQQEALAALEDISLSNDALPYGLVLFKDDYHQGVIGILAGRIKDKYHRPTIAFAVADDGGLKGSARSIPGLHIRDLLEELNSRYPKLIEKFGGHAMAAGLSISRESLEPFIQCFHQLAEEWLKDQPLQKEVLSDGELAAEEYSLEFANQLKDSGPWGQQFPEPVFDEQFELVQQRIVGSKHLKMMLKNKHGLLLDAIAFNVDLNIWPASNTSQAHLAFKLDINEFRGKTSLQLLVEALHPL